MACGVAEAKPVVPVELPTNESSDRLLRLRHTSSHVMAMAVQKLYPGAQVTIGPWIDNGFYYDFDVPEGTELNLKKIKKRMDRIIAQKLPLVREEVSREEARARITALGEPYKLEILDSIESEPITIYHCGDEWWDLCAGPHVEHTGELNKHTIALESTAGAYWRGDADKAMLTRIYGTAWETPEQLAYAAHLREEAARRDHRALGKALDLFSIQQESAGGGLVFWHPKGALMRHQIEDYWKQMHFADGYELVYTPHVAKLDMWKTSGHFDFYAENMFDQMAIEDETYQLRPMNCPFHVAIYKSAPRSYRQLPLRWAELGTVYRYEKSGTMHGLFRVRGFTQDDAHIFCLPEQIEGEILRVLNLTEAILSNFGFEKYEINLSTRPEKSVGEDAIWEKATAGLVAALEAKGWDYVVDEGGGAFYGPKIDLKIQDAIGRKWQCSTIQLDFNLPERFDMSYVDSTGAKERPIMIHRAIFGSLERFFGILVENYAGDFPIWMAPEQCRLLPVSDAAAAYAEAVAAKLRARGVRVSVGGGERLAKLIRNAEIAKVPVVGVVGARDEEAGEVSVRTRADGELGALKVDELVERLAAAATSKGAF
eukprot:PRCOL_00005026-RA